MRLHINSIEGKIYSNIITLYAASPRRRVAASPRRRLRKPVKCQSQTTNLQYNKTLFMSIITQILLKGLKDIVKVCSQLIEVGGKLRE